MLTAPLELAWRRLGSRLGSAFWSRIQPYNCELVKSAKRWQFFPPDPEFRALRALFEVVG